MRDNEGRLYYNVSTLDWNGLDIFSEETTMSKYICRYPENATIKYSPPETQKEVRNNGKTKLSVSGERMCTVLVNRLED